MYLMRKVAVLSLLLCTGAVFAAPRQSMVETEYAFGRAVEQHGLRVGFLSYLDEDAIAFVPQPMDAKAFYSSREPGPSTLRWQPVMARLAASGDFGFTTGPWQVSFTGRDGKPATMYGDYATLWHRLPDGSWRWLLDAGVAHERPASPVMALPDDANSKAYLLHAAKRYRKASATELTDLDVKYTRLATHDGMHTMFETLGMDDMRLLQFQSQPLVGRVAVLKQTPNDKAGLQWIASGSGIANSNDLGYTYGMAYPLSAEQGRAPQSVYLHIWQRTRHGWRLLLDLENALPPPRGARPSPG